MRIRVAALVVAHLCSTPASAQETLPPSARDTLPVVSARSRNVTVTDGLHVKKNYWYVMPERSPDIYYVEIPLQPHTVTFTTDTDAVSFPVTYGSRHRFVVRLDDGREALTEIRAEFRDLRSPEDSSASETGTQISFRLGDNDKIYVNGRINGGPLLDLQFDLGAGGTLIKKASVPKAPMTFDGTITLRNSDGVHQVPSSSGNTVEIAGLRWTGVSVAVADNMTHREDGLVGNWLFRDKVVEIDHDRMVIVVHDRRPAPGAGWTREDIFLDGGTVPFVRGRLGVGDAVRDGWFLLDTGAYTSILHSDRLTAMTKMIGEFRHLLGPLGGRHHSPVLAVGGQTFTNTNYSVRAYDGEASDLGVLGGDVLKRFNLILDNRQGSVYFKPNGRRHDAYRNPERLLARVALAVGAAAAAAAVIWRIRR